MRGIANQSIELIVVIGLSKVARGHIMAEHDGQWPGCGFCENIFSGTIPLQTNQRSVIANLVKVHDSNMNY